MRSRWTNRLSFIITTASFAIGLGNIWRFPYLVGSNGGGAFLLVYLVLIFLIGIPILLTEISLGRMSQTTPLLGFGQLSGKKGWNVLGWIQIMAGFLIMGYYVMIMSWVVIYFLESLNGRLPAVPAQDYAGHFEQVIGASGPVFLYSLLLIAACGLVVNSGLKNGIERLARWLMPLLLLLIIGLGMWAVTLKGAPEGIRWYLSTDFSLITFPVILAAMGQLFFSVGVGFGAAFIFGSYLGEEDDIVTSTGIVVFADSFVAFLAGFMIFPALFAYGIPPDAGPSLVFITMAQLFAELPMGQLFGSLFFLLLIVAGFTSLIAAIESFTTALSDYYLWARRPSLLIVLLIILGLSVPNILSYSTERLANIGGRSFFDWMDLLTNVVLLPLSGLLLIIFAGYVLRFPVFREATNRGASFFRVTNFWSFLMRVLTPLGVLTILYQNITNLINQ